MTQSVACNTCHKAYAFKPALAGKRVKCKCGGRVVFPKVEQEPLLELPDSEMIPIEDDPYELREPPRPQRSAPVATLPAVESNTFPCANCGAQLANGTVLCVTCGCNQRTGQVLRTTVESSPKFKPKPAPAAASSGSDSGGHSLFGEAYFTRLALSGTIIGVGAPLLSLGDTQFRVLSSMDPHTVPFVGVAIAGVGAVLWAGKNNYVMAGLTAVGGVASMIIALAVGKH